MKKIDLLHEYLYNTMCFLEEDIAQLQENLRYRRISDIDCLELIIAKSKYDMFMQVYKTIADIYGFAGLDEK